MRSNRYCLTVTALVAVCVSSSDFVGAAELKTYILLGQSNILLGQSNMEGYGLPAQSRNGKRAHRPIPSLRLADIGRADLDKEQTGVRYTSGGRWSPLTTRGGAAWGSRFGVEVSFGAAMLKSTPEEAKRAEGDEIDPEAMQRTFDLIWKQVGEGHRWMFWGCDFPMMAMTAARLGKPGAALDAYRTRKHAEELLKQTSDEK